MSEITVRSHLVMLRLFLFLLTLNYFNVSFADSRESYGYTMPDYGFEWTKKSNLRNSLSKKFALKKQSEARVRKLKERIANDTEYYDDIPHFKISVSENVKKNSIQFEDNFKNIMQMVGVTYIYKRDLYWRTWREVTYPNSSSKNVVCYKCQNIINYTENNYTACHPGGYWAIEDEPPSCSFEILSFTGKNQLCIGKFWELKNENASSCPTSTTFEELSLCDNPIITKVRVSPDYSTLVSERASTVICQGREECEFSTFYKIDSDIIIFRIINSSNDVIYSRLMKTGENYVCIDDCGHFDYDTMTLTRNENHVILNLLKDYTRKRKRDNSYTVYKNGKNTRKESNNALRQSLFHKTHKYVLEQPFTTEKYRLIKATLSFCNKMVSSEVDKDYDYDGA